MPSPILASVGILTLNSEKHIARALESVRDFDDVYVCDGNSTDNTQTIARQHNARIVPQDDSGVPNIRIQDFGKARTHCLRAAKHDWYLRIDSDEYLSAEAAEEIRALITQPGAEAFVYKIPRKYVFRDTIIERATTYPNRQPRLFHRSAVASYTKLTHERPVLNNGVTYKNLQHPLYVPIEDTYAGHWKKFEATLRFDERQTKNITFAKWLHATKHSALLATLYTARLVRNHLLPGKTLPLRFDAAWILYLCCAWWVATKNLVSIKKSNA